MTSPARQHKVISRKRLLRWLIPTIAVCTVFTWLALELTQQWIAQLQAQAEVDPEAARDRAVSALGWLIGGAGLATCALAAYLAHYARRIVESGVAPPPGAWVLEGRPTYAGRKAVRMGATQMLLAILLLLCGCGLLYLAWASPQRLLADASSATSPARKETTISRDDVAGVAGHTRAVSAQRRPLRTGAAARTTIVWPGRGR